MEPSISSFSFLTKRGEISRQSAIIGLHHQGTYSAYNWIEIINMASQVDFDPGENIFFSFTAGNLTKPLFKHLINLIPPGGHIMVEYDSPERWATARLLASGIPPVATPIGYTLFTAGCDAGFRDWYIAEGGNEGLRKLQGFKSLNSRHSEVKTKVMAIELDDFLHRPPSAAAPQLEREARERASVVLKALHY